MGRLWQKKIAEHHSNYVAEHYLVSVEVVVWAVSAERDGMSAEATSSHGGGVSFFEEPFKWRPRDIGLRL
jgi:hypothetical protein